MSVILQTGNSDIHVRSHKSRLIRETNKTVGRTNSQAMLTMTLSPTLIYTCHAQKISPSQQHDHLHNFHQWKFQNQGKIEAWRCWMEHMLLYQFPNLLLANSFLLCTNVVNTWANHDGSWLKQYAHRMFRNKTNDFHSKKLNHKLNIIESQFDAINPTERDCTFHCFDLLRHQSLLNFT